MKPDSNMAEDLVLEDLIDADAVEEAVEVDAVDAADAFGAAVEVDPTAGAAPQPPSPLTERDRRILAFERKWWRHAGAKEQAIRDDFDLSSTRYYQILNGLLDNPAALEHDPVLVGRLRRLRSTRSRTRGTGRVA
jgi:hypothetical protein